MKTKIMQVVRLVVMVIAIAGIIYAIESATGIARWFWIVLLAVGFFGLLFAFQQTRRRLHLERRARERKEKQHEKRRQHKARRGK